MARASTTTSVTAELGWGLSVCGLSGAVFGGTHSNCMTILTLAASSPTCAFLLHNFYLSPLVLFLWIYAFLFFSFCFSAGIGTRA